MSKIAAIQMCSSHILNDNLKIASRLINEAAKNEAKLVVLPEMFAVMGLTPRVLSKKSQELHYSNLLIICAEL